MIYRRRSRLGRQSPRSRHRRPTLLPFTFGRHEKRPSHGSNQLLGPKSKSTASATSDSDSDHSNALTFTQNIPNSSSIGDVQATKGDGERSQHVQAASVTATCTAATSAAAATSPSLSQSTTGLRSGTGSGTGNEEASSESRGVADSEITVSREEWVRMRDEVLRLRGLQLQQHTTQNSSEDEVPPPYTSARNEG
jgi:hypothetical protein